MAEPAAFFGFDIGSPKAAIPRSGLVHARFKIGRLLDQDGRKLRVCGGFGELEKSRRLTHEIQSAYHGGFPVLPS